MKTPKQVSIAATICRVSRILLISAWILCLSCNAFSQGLRVTLVLYKGEVVLLDTDKNERTTRVGQQITTEATPWIKTGKNSSFFLQSGNRLVEIEREGVYAIDQLFEDQSSVWDRSLTFLKDLVAPRSYVSQARVRGEQSADDQDAEQIFEALWRDLVIQADPSEQSFKTEDLLAAAAWYQQQEKPARVAYILERLNMRDDERNAFYQQMRMEALQTVTLSDINQELEQTRKSAINSLDLGDHKALLIGINQYENPEWQTLQTPVRDVRELKRLLVKDYLFEEKDIFLLENASFEEIIGAFNDIRQQSTEKTSLLIYYAGHGYYPPGEDEGYWVPRDGGDPETLKLFIPASTILSKIKSIESRHTLVIADSCFSGSLVRVTRGAEIHSRYYRDLSTKKSRQIITSGGLEPVSDQGWGDNSVFAGKLIDILSRKRSEPLSASELALHLRKEVKNADALQTPEYGRLYVADDQSGEFFFVRKDQDLTQVMRQREEVYPPRGLDSIETRAEEQPLEIPDKDGYRFNFGAGFHMAVLNYKFSYTDSNGEEKTVSDSTSLTGAVGLLGVKYTEDRFSYEIMTRFGQISSSAVECDEEDENTEFCSRYAGSSSSGQYTAFGVAGSYNVLPPFYFDVELGGGFVYERYTFNKLLDERDLDTSFVSACGRAEISYLINNWFIGERNSFCFRVYQLGGSLPDFENNSLSDLKIPFSMEFSIIAGYRF